MIQYNLILFILFCFFISCSHKNENTFKESEPVIEKMYLPFTEGSSNINKFEALLGEWDIRKIIITKRVEGKRDSVININKDTTIHISITRKGIFNNGIRIGESFGENSTLFTLKLDTLECRYFVMGKDINKSVFFIMQSPSVKYLKNGQLITSLKSRLYLVRTLE
ncbi:hypothetical protein [Apibacter sp. HY039]|uniref:hypothetical protein n=1 Tax=Apibacter sp. HY039 TaxID=2501476 RepID=UPI000FEB6006|nr:hypothetical protein [Apibacter sp. HY039]